MTSVEDAARTWVSRGYWVAPVSLRLENGKKVPRFPGGSWNSTNDPNKIPDLFCGSDGLAVDTGKSGVVVLDVDLAENKSGYTNLSREGIDLPATKMRARTWSGGWHGFYRQPQNPVGTGQNKPVLAVDYRGTGGLAFAWPSVVLSPGGQELGKYTLNAVVPVGELDVLPEDFARLLRVKPPERKLEGRTALSGVLILREDQIEVLERYLESDLTVIRQARSGARNEALGRTLVIADRCRKLGLDQEEYEVRVLDAYRESGGEDFKQARDWCRSGWLKSLEEPLGVPRTRVDTLADNRHEVLVADRLARSRLATAGASLIKPSSFVDWTKEPEPAQFWVSGVLPKGEQVILYGKTEAGKTFTALDWALSVASGRDWFGRRTGQARVWFMSGEGNTRITARLHAWIKHHQTDPSPEWFSLLNHVPDLMSEQVIEDLAQKIAEAEVDLLFVDTMNRAMALGGGNISDPLDANAALRSLAHISKYRPTTTPVALHHPIKDGSMAGAYNLSSGVDVMLHAEVDASNVGTLKFDKNKDGEKTVICQYRWRPIGESAVLVPFGG